MNKRKGIRKLTKIIYIIIFILIALTIVLLIKEFLPEKINNPWKEPELYKIKDECSLILNNLIHQIKTEGDCRIRCRNECTVRNKQIQSSQFLPQEADCNICNCYCK